MRSAVGIFWGLFAAYHLLYFVFWLVFGATNTSGTGAADAVDWLRVLAPILAFSLLAIARSRWLDYLLPAALIIFYVARYWNATLSA